jgi:hypothetical protein
MNACIPAQSISRTVRQRLDAAPFAARVQAVFEHACDLIASDGDVVALVSRRIGAGPLNVVVDAGPEAFRRLQAGMSVCLERGCLHVGPLMVSLEEALIWDARPDWERLRTCAITCRERLRLVRDVTQRLAPAGSLLSLVDAATAGKQDGALCRHSAGGATPRSSGPLQTFDVTCAAAARALPPLRAGWQGDAVLLREGAAQLAGLGGGLTPAGDDWLCGAMLAAWLAHPHPGWLCERIVAAVAGRTTLLSTAFLRAAGRGECASTWHRLLAALCAGTPAETEAAVRDVLSLGATSGADTLAGFLWAALD